MSKATDFKQMLLDDCVLISGNAVSHVIDFIKNEYDPEDVFSETQLEKWAEANGYVKADQP